MNAKLSSCNIVKQLSAVDSPIRFKSYVIRQNLHGFLSRIDNALEEIDIDKVDKDINKNDNKFEELPIRNVKVLTSKKNSQNSLTTSSFSEYEANVDFDEQTLLDEISEFNLD